jgi:hypothetical protein
MAANMTDDLLNNDMDFMLSQVAQCSNFNPTCDAQMRTGIYLLNAVCLKYDHFFVAYVNWALLFSIGLQCMCIERRLICLV